MMSDGVEKTVFYFEKKGVVNTEKTLEDRKSVV